MVLQLPVIVEEYLGWLGWASQLESIIVKILF